MGVNFSITIFYFYFYFLIVDVAAVNLQVAVSLLRMCDSFCRIVHIARVTPPSLASDGLRSFDEEVKQCFVMCSANTFFCRLRNELDRKYAPSRIWRRSLHACVVHAAYM